MLPFGNIRPERVNMNHCFFSLSPHKTFFLLERYDQNFEFGTLTVSELNKQFAILKNKVKDFENFLLKTGRIITQEIHEGSDPNNVYRIR
jgi:hypothetical protein